jgi:hypothetical protein
VEQPVAHDDDGRRAIRPVVTAGRRPETCQSAHLGCLPVIKASFSIEDREGRSVISSIKNAKPDASDGRIASSFPRLDILGELQPRSRSIMKQEDASLNMQAWKFCIKLRCGREQM